MLSIGQGSIEHYVLIGLCILWAYRYKQKGDKRISDSKEYVSKTFNDFERSLRRSHKYYKCYTNNHPYVWDGGDYQTLKDQLLSAPRWKLGPRPPTLEIAEPFLLKVNEDKQYIYVVFAEENFDWDSLYHYGEPPQSLVQIAKNIADYKSGKL